MKPIFTSTIEYRLARHDRRAASRHPHPATDHFFRPLTDASASRAWRQPNPRARHAFRRMTAEMQARYERDEPIELALFACVAALAAWPLFDLLLVLAQTANG